eukprot:m.459630 g.459630  ORF g.459630 m.459630 type:complete len:146 (+) comp57009_c0_seq13:1785-2222(+)
MFAKSDHFTHILKVLDFPMQFGREFIEVEDRILSGLTCLLATCEAENVELGVVQFLVSQLGADVRATDSLGATCIQLAAKQEVADWLQHKCTITICEHCFVEINARIHRCLDCHQAPYCSEQCRVLGVARHSQVCLFNTMVSQQA